MRKIVVCEGDSDSIFLQETIKKLGFQNNELKLFNQEKGVKLPGQKDKETEVLKNFIPSSTYNHQKILIKNECNKDSAIKLFCSELIHHLGQVELTILLDCDCLSVEQKQSCLRKHITEHFKDNDVDLEFISQPKNHSYLDHSICNVNINGAIIGTFHSVLFKSTLENACNIDDKEKRNEKDKKIRQFVNLQDTPHFFSNIIKTE